MEYNISMDIDNEFVEKYGALITERIDRAGISGEFHSHVTAKIYERIITSNSYDPDRGKISTWLWQVCRSVISNEVKKQGRSQDAMDHNPIALEDANNIIGVEDAGDAAAELDRLFKNVGLSARDIAIVKAVKLHEIPPQDLADEFDLGVRAVEQIVYRAMKALKAEVAKA